MQDLGDLAIPHAIVGVNKLFKLFYTILYDKLCGISMSIQQYNILNKTKTFALLNLNFWQEVCFIIIDMYQGGVMILKRTDIKKLGVSKILIWSLNITYQKSKKSMNARPCHQEPKFSSLCMETD
jgi:hypothetical protein